MSDESHTPEDQDKSQVRAERWKRELYVISQGDLGKILADHERGLKSDWEDGERAVLSGADLSDLNIVSKNLSEANLSGSKFEGSLLYEVTGLDKANLSDCDMSGARALKGDEFARADVTGAKLPKDIAKWQVLEVITETSKNARKIFLAMLLGCVYSWLTIASTTDANLLTNSASSPLPIIGTTVPISWFYLAAPLMLVGLYLYFHLYLQRLWKGLASLPAIFEDGKQLDERAYPWLLNGLVRLHFHELKARRTALDKIEECATIILAWWVVPLTVLLFWWRFLPSRDVLVTISHIFLYMIVFWLAVGTYSAHRRTLRGTAQTTRPAWHGVLLTLIVAVQAAALLWLSPLGWSEPRNLRDAQLSEQNVSLRGVRLECSNLEGADVSTVDFENADLWGTNLRNADLRRASLERVNLNFADATNADFVEADFSEATLTATILAGADLSRTVGLTQAQLDEACGDSLTVLPAGLTISICSDGDLELVAKACEK